MSKNNERVVKIFNARVVSGESGLIIELDGTTRISTLRAIDSVSLRDGRFAPRALLDNDNVGGKREIAIYAGHYSEADIRKLANSEIGLQLINIRDKTDWPTRGLQQFDAILAEQEPDGRVKPMVTVPGF